MVAAVHPFWRLMQRFRDDWRLFALLMVANALGIGYGYYYYWDVGQFDPASTYYQMPWWWGFVADSPNAVVLMSASLILYRFGGRRSRVLDSLAFVHMVFVGLWTTYLFAMYPDPLGTWDWGGTNNILFFSHLGMPLEALVLVPGLRKDRIPPWLVGGIVAWGGLNLWLDYGPPSLRPAPFIDAGPAFAVGSVILMVVAVAAWIVLCWPAIARRTN